MNLPTKKKKATMAGLFKILLSIYLSLLFFLCNIFAMLHFAVFPTSFGRFLSIMF